MKKSAIVAILASTALVPAAIAESDLYMNGGVSSFDADGAALNAFTARGGISFNDLLSAEFEASFGLGADESGGVDSELENQFGGFVLASYPVLRNLDVHGRIGYTSAEIQTANNGVSSDVDADGFAFGIGSEFMLNEQFGIRGDYTRIEADDDQFDGGINVFAVTGVYRFGSVR